MARAVQVNQSRRAALPIAAALIGLAIVLGFLEIVFRILPTAQPTYSSVVNEADPYPHFRPGRRVRTSKGWNFEFVSYKATNNAGFFSDYTYSRAGGPPLLAVIGDSYVEALQVDNSESIHGLLGQAVGREGRVYAFGVSGAPLSQYLAYAEYARRNFEPTAYVFVIVSNDFDESLLKYNHGLGSHYFVEIEDELRLERLDRPDHPLAIRIARESALISYLVRNLGFDWSRLASALGASAAVAPGIKGPVLGNAPYRVAPEREQDSYRAVDVFLQRLPAACGVPPSNILLMLDGVRDAIYREVDGQYLEMSFAERMRSYTAQSAIRQGFEVVDLHPVFAQEYIESGRQDKFEYPSDGHWNELGHFVAARAVTRSRMFNQLFGSRSLPGVKPAGRRYSTEMQQ